MLQKLFGILRYCVKKLQRRTGYVYYDAFMMTWAKLGMFIILRMLEDPVFSGTFDIEAIMGFVSLMEVVLHHALSLVLNGLLAKCKFKLMLFLFKIFIRYRAEIFGC